MRRVKDVTVTPHYCPIQDKDASWYKQFNIIILGLDSVEVTWLKSEARRLLLLCDLASIQLSVPSPMPTHHARLAGPTVAQRDGMRYGGVHYR